MNPMSNYEQFFRQLSDVQKVFLNSWNAMTDMQNANAPNLSENVNKTLKFQEEILTSSLEFQALVARMSIETQKQFWQGYFNLVRMGQIKQD
jgi:hypothetical protein